MTDLDRFRHPLDIEGSFSLFLDTSALLPHVYNRATRHDEVREVMDAIAHDDLSYDPLLTNQWVLDELVSILLSREGSRIAHEALERVVNTDMIRVLGVEPELVDQAITIFRRLDDQAISLTDHVIAVQLNEINRPNIFTYDPDDFETLGMEPIPHY